MNVKDKLTMARCVAMTVAIGKELLPEVLDIVKKRPMQPDDARMVVESHFENGFRWVSKPTMMMFTGALLSLGEDAKQASRVEER